MSDEAIETAVGGVVRAYEAAVAAASSAAVMELYADDAVFMPQRLPTFAGREAIGLAYAEIFKRVTVAIRFSIVEVRVLARDCVAVRTTSSVDQTAIATATTSHESNRELFVLRRDGGTWKIVYYVFSNDVTFPIEGAGERA